MYNCRYYVKNCVKWVQENNHHDFLSIFFIIVYLEYALSQHMLKGVLHENNLHIFFLKKLTSL